MTMLRLVGLGVGAVALVGALLIATLLVVYRPTVEYAYVGILDGSEHAISGWWLLGGGFVALVAVVAILLIRGRRSVAK